jgi:hypothetical protein
VLSLLPALLFGLIGGVAVDRFARASAAFLIGGSLATIVAVLPLLHPAVRRFD